MFDAGLFEMLVIFTLGLLVLGPERLPRVARFVGRWVGQARRAVTRLNNEIERELALDEIRRIQRESEEAMRREEASIRRELSGEGSEADDADGSVDDAATGEAPAEAHGTARRGGTAAGAPASEGAADESATDESATAGATRHDDAAAEAGSDAARR